VAARERQVMSVHSGGARLTRHSKVCLGLIIFVSLAILSLVGCGAIGEKYTYIEWSTDYFEKYYPRWFEDFEKLHADEYVRIKFRAMPSNAAQSIYTMMISHTLSDVVVVGTGVSSLLLENNALEPVPDGLIDKSDCMEVTLSWPTYKDGTLAACPGSIGIRPYIYFDSADLKEAGTSLAEMPDTYDAYRTWAEKLFKRDVGGKVVIGALPADEAAGAKILRRPLGITRGHVPSFYPFMLAYLDPMPDPDTGKSDNSLDDYIGGPPHNRPFKFTSPEFIKGLEEWRKFYLPEKTAICDGTADRLYGLQNEGYAGAEAGNWIFGEVYSIDMLVAPLPHAPGRPSHLYCGPGAEGVSRDSKNKKLAFAWAKYITDTNQQVDGYYGHGYTVGKFSAWKRLDEDDKEDQEIRAQFLEPFSEGHGDYICQPAINRTSHDSMDVVLYVALTKDIAIVKARSWEPQAAVGAAAEETTPANAGDIDQIARAHAGEAKALADKIAAKTNVNVTVIVRGTPPEFVALRSNIRRSPIPAYLPLLADAVFQPNMKIWDRIMGEVVADGMQRATKAEGAMSAEDTAKWMHEQAEAIVAGRK